MKSVFAIIAMVFLAHMTEGRSVSNEKFRLFRAGIKVAKRLCKQNESLKSKVCTEFMSLLTDTMKNTEGGSTKEGGNTTPSTGDDNPNDPSITNMFGNNGLQWGG